MTLSEGEGSLEINFLKSKNLDGIADLNQMFTRKPIDTFYSWISINFNSNISDSVFEVN